MPPNPKTRGWLACPAGSLALADLHLRPDEEPRLESFLEWLAAQRGLPRLLLLGDLFDVWVGPAQARQAGSARVLEGLRELVEAGTAIDLVPGNRDFLLGPDFERETGVRLWPHGLGVLAPSGERVFCLHGDEFCTRDRAYQRLKRVLRCAPMRALSRALPLWLARRAARRLRAQSVTAVAAKPPEEKAMQPSAVLAFLEAQGAQVMVCGHAHEYRDLRLAPGRRWLVLDAWGGERDLLLFEESAAGGLQASSTRRRAAPPGAGQA